MIYRLLIAATLATTIALTAQAQNASISGILQLDGKPAPNANVSIGSQFRDDRYNEMVKTGGDGRFQFSDLAPGWYTVGHLTSYTVLTGTSSTTPFTPNRTRFVYLKPGENATITIGDQKGANVSGTFTAPDDSPITLGWQSGHTRALSTDRPKAKPPHDLMGDALDAWYAAYYHSPEFIAECTKSTSLVVDIAADGTFSIDNVPPGDYTLVADFRGKDDPVVGPVAANVYATFTVPDAPTFDAGAIPVKISDAAKVRAKGLTLAPRLVVANLDGGTIRLSDYKGKYVLIDFWAVWCGPCKAEMPFLKSVWNTYGDRDDFAMIGLSLDKAEATPRQYAAQNGLAWTHGFLGDWGKTDVPGTWGVDAIPSIFLIGPDGEIVAKGLRKERIKAAVDAALAK